MSVLNEQLWDALLKVECSSEDVSSQWEAKLKKDLKKRIHEVSFLSTGRKCLLLSKMKPFFSSEVSVSVGQ